MRILALILARGGSKRLPKKNIRELGGKPLIVWSIETAKQIPEVVDTLVSTDCVDIAAVSRSEGARVPWLRPGHLSTDSSTSVDAALHGVDWYEAECGLVDGIMLLQPTSPFRDLSLIQDAIRIFETDVSVPIVSVSKVTDVPAHPEFCFIQIEGNMERISDWEKLRYHLQNNDPVFMLNGSIYLIAPGILRRERTFVPQTFRSIVMTNDDESLDIDTEIDWETAQEIVRRRSTAA